MSQYWERITPRQAPRTIGSRGGRVRLAAPIRERPTRATRWLRECVAMAERDVVQTQWDVCFRALCPERQHGASFCEKMVRQTAPYSTDALFEPRLLYDQCCIAGSALGKVRQLLGKPCDETGLCCQLQSESGHLLWPVICRGLSGELHVTSSVPRRVDRVEAK